VCVTWLQFGSLPRVGGPDTLRSSPVARTHARTRAMSKLDLLNTMRAFLERNKLVWNSMQTTQTLEFVCGNRAGTVQLKFWRQFGILFVKQIELERWVEGQPRHCLTHAVRTLTRDNTSVTRCGLRSVVLESVLSKDLRTKLLGLGEGWEIDANAPESNLVMHVVTSGNPACCFCARDVGPHGGNNPQPVRDSGRCCDECNINVVIRARLNLHLAASAAPQTKQ